MSANEFEPIDYEEESGGVRLIYASETASGRALEQARDADVVYTGRSFNGCYEDPFSCGPRMKTSDERVERHDEAIFVPNSDDEVLEKLPTGKTIRESLLGAD